MKTNFNPFISMRNKAILIVLFLGVSLCGYGQKSFIGQTKAQIRDYWSLHVSSEYFDEGKYDDTGEEYFDIMKANVGAPDFTATFDKAGKCKEQSIKIQSEEVSVYTARLKKLGYALQGEEFKKAGSNVVWYFENNSGVRMLTAKKA